MLKKWETVYTNANTNKISKSTQAAADKVYNRKIKSLKNASYTDLKQEGDMAFANKLIREDDIITSFEAKKLKSKALIAEAKNILADREKRAKKKNNRKDAEKVG